MSADQQTIDISSLRRDQPRFQGIESGHRACLGCGEALAARLVTEAAGPDVMIANATGCLEIFTTPWPESSWRLPWMHSLFENTGAIAAGIQPVFIMRTDNPTDASALDFLHADPQTDSVQNGFSKNAVTIIRNLQEVLALAA